MRKRLLIIAVALIIVVPLVSGCQIIYSTRVMVNGGGWIEAPVLTQGETVETERLEKATFGFSFDWYNIVWEGETPGSWDVKGHLTYIDHLNGVRIIGKITGISKVVDGGIVGSYGDGGTFTFMPIAGNNPEDSDYFEISITGGEHDSYMNEGMVEGGNIQTISFPE